MKPCTLYVVRHGQSEANRDKVCGGQLDFPLTEAGIRQAEEAKELLSEIHFDDVYSSDLQRASKTAGIIYGSSVPANHQLPGLRERYYGHLEGGPMSKFTEIHERFTNKYGKLPIEERWKHSYADGIESNAVLYDRFAKSLLEIASKHPGETILVGAHGGCIRALLTYLGHADESDLPPGSFSNAAHIVLTSDGHEFEIKQVNGVKSDAK